MPVKRKAKAAPRAAALTRSFTNNRDGANLQETVLTPAAIRQRGLVKAFTLQTQGDARGCEAQPLIIPDVKLTSGEVKDIAILATMANTLWAYDANTGEPLWMTRLGKPIKGSRMIDGWLINDNWGILSTPVVDVEEGVLYVVAWISPDGTPNNSGFTMFEVAFAEGKITRKCNLGTATYSPGGNLPVQKFSSAARKQRCSLLYDHGYVYAGFGTIAETSRTAQGWVIAVDVNNLKVAGAWTSTARGSGAGIWMAGQGLAADADGNVYLMTGNGDFDGVTDFGESFCKLGWVKGKLQAVDWWSPFSDAGREGRDPTTRPKLAASAQEGGRKLTGTRETFETDAAIHGGMGTAVDAQGMPIGMPMNMPGMDMGGMTEAEMRDMHPDMPMPMDMPAAPGDASDDDDGPPQPTNVRNYAAVALGAYSDMDLGSGGCLVINELGIVLGAGKDGILYVMHTDQMGKTQPGDFANPAGNYAKLASPPIWFTYYAAGKNAAPQNFADLNFLYGGKTHHQHSTPVYYKSKKLGRLIFTWGENGNLRAWRLNDDCTLTYLASSLEVASILCVNPPGGMPGGMLSLSANNDDGGAVLWATYPLGDGNMTVTQGHLVAFDAENFVNGVIPKLWSTADWGLGYVYNKFNVPIAVNGKVYVPNYTGGVDVYTLTPQP